MEEYIFEWWHVPVGIIVFVIALYTHSLFMDNWPFKNDK